jgi:peptidyl-prolyl cis-trans isomerase C
MSLSLRVPAAAAALALSGLIAMTAIPQPAMAQEDGVAAIVNGDKILVKDVDKAIEMLGVKGTAVDRVKPEVLNQIINEKLIEEAMVKAKIDESAEYKKRMDVLKIQLQRQIFVEQQIQGKIGDKQVRAEYDKFVKQNKGKTEVRARHILVPSEQEALQIIKDLDGGADFVDLAKKRSSDPSAARGGDLGYFLKEEMVPEFSKEAFAIKTGGYSKTPVKTQFGYHVIKVEDKRERAVPKFEEVAGAIQQQLGNQALQKLVADLRAKADIDIKLAGAEPNAAPEKSATKKN